jgi:hypothetical protein
MKKLFLLAVIATALVSCNKFKPVGYQGSTVAFKYVSSGLTVVSQTTVGTTSVLTLNDGRKITLQAMNAQSTDGTCFLLEAPFIPTVWTWYDNGEYRAEGMDWNASAGFTKTVCKAYFVARDPNSLAYTLHQVGVWGTLPDASGWVNSFNSFSGVSQRTFPVMGIVKMSLSGQNYWYTCSF